MREKLIELCEDVILSCKASLCSDCEHNGIDYPNCMGVHFADHLIAHGVTVQEWISVNDRLPDMYQNVLAIRADGKIVVDAIGSLEIWYKQMDIVGRPVTHWMSLPQPPKGE